MNVFLLCLGLGISLGISVPAFAGLSAQQIMEKNEEARRLDDIQAEATLNTAGGTRKEAMKKFRWWKKLLGDKVHYNSLTTFTAPAEIRNEAILFLEKTGGDNEILLYLPNFKKTRRVEGQQQSASFMSSDFSYTDITTPHIADYKYALKGEGACPGLETAAGGCYTVEAVPATPTVKERTGYSKTTNWLRKDNFMLSQVEYFDLGDKLVKRLRVGETKLVDPKNQKYFSHQLEMDVIANKQSTKLKFEKSKVNAGIADSVFNKSNLGK